MHSSPFSALSVLSLSVFASIGAQAGVVTQFGNRALFTTAVGGTLTVEDFTDNAHFPITTGILNSTTSIPAATITPGMIKPGVTYSTPVGSGNFFNIDSGGGYVGGFLDGFFPSTRDLTVTFDSNVASFGFDTGIHNGTSFDVIVQFATGPDQAFNFLTPPNIQFFGFQSTAVDIKSVIIGNNDSGFGFNLDNFTFGGTPVPEPDVTALLGLGAIVVSFRRRTKR